MNRRPRLDRGRGMSALEWTRGILRRPRRGLRGLAVVTAAGLMLSADDWNMFRYGLARTGFNNTESAISVSNVSSLAQLYTGSCQGPPAQLLAGGDATQPQSGGIVPGLAPASPGIPNPLIPGSPSTPRAPGTAGGPGGGPPSATAPSM
jgi:hypothetical protein